MNNCITLYPLTEPRNSGVTDCAHYVGLSGKGRDSSTDRTVTRTTYLSRPCIALIIWFCSLTGTIYQCSCITHKRLQATINRIQKLFYREIYTNVKMDNTSACVRVCVMTPFKVSTVEHNYHLQRVWKPLLRIQCFIWHYCSWCSGVKMPNCHFPVNCTIIWIPFTPETEHFNTVITSFNVVVIELPVTAPVAF
jgi:hypothetical protein